MKIEFKKKNTLCICFATEDFYPKFIGGQGIYGYHLVEELVKQGHRVTVLAEKRNGRKAFWNNKKNVSLLHTPFCFGNQLILALFEYLFFLMKLRNIPFDILHANQISGLFFILFRPKNINKIIVSVHNTNYDMEKKTQSILKKILYQPLIFLERIVYQNADGLLFNSLSEEKTLREYYKIKEPTKIVYLGVTIPMFTNYEQNQAKKNIIKSLHLPKNSQLILYLGRLVKRKKIDTILGALKHIGQKDQTFFGIIVGKGTEQKLLKKNAPKNTRFLGFVDNPKQYFLAADVFVTVSVAEGGFLLSALEAASYGLPLILSPSAAGFPILKDGVNGFLADPDDKELLAKKIVDALKKKKVFGIQSKRLAKQFTWTKCCEETILFYKTLVEKPSDNL